MIRQSPNFESEFDYKFISRFTRDWKATLCRAEKLGVLSRFGASKWYENSIEQFVLIW